MKKVLSTVVCAAMGFSMFAAPVTLTVLDYQDATSPNSFDDNKLVWDAFEEAHPDIKIEREALFNEPFHQKTEAYAASGNMPDVFYMWPGGRSGVIHTKKLAKDLTPFMKKDGILKDYKEICVDPTQQMAGYVAEIPFGLTSTNCVFANMKVLNENGMKPAKTYDELKKQVKKLEAKGLKGIIMANHDDWVMQSCLFSMVAGRFGGTTWADDVLAGKTRLTDDGPFKKAVAFVKQMYDDGVLSQESLNTNYGEVPGQFATNMGAYLIDGDWRAGAFMTDASTGDALIPADKQVTDVELIQFPKIPGEVLHESNSGTLGVGYGMSASIPAGSDKEAAAWELIKWLSGPEMQQRRLDTGASFPSLNEGISYDNLEPLAEKRADWYGTAAAVTPVFDGVFPPEVASVLNAELQKLGLGVTDVDKVCTAVEKALFEVKPELKPADADKKAEKKWWQFWK